MKNRLILTLLGLALGFVATSASAHTSSIGFLPGDNPGEVVFWTGTYSHGSCPPANEGTLTLTGIDGTVYGPVELAFDIPAVCTKPAGLVDGTNNCYWDTANNGSSYYLDCDLVASPAWLNNIGGAVQWQGVVFSGLQAGTYSFTCGDTCGITATWNTLPGASGEGTLVLGQGDIGGGNIPVPTLSVAGKLALLLLFGLLGTLYTRARLRG